VTDNNALWLRWPSVVVLNALLSSCDDMCRRFTTVVLPTRNLMTTLDGRISLRLEYCRI